MELNAREIIIKCIIREINPTCVSKITKEASDEELKKVYQIAKAHDLTHIVGKVLQIDKFVVNKDIVERFTHEMVLAVYRYEQKKQVLKAISNILEEKQIPYVLLKGAVLSDYYPEAWLRTSCDIDVLVQQDKIQKTVNIFCEELGCRCEGKGTHDVQLYTSDNVHIEVHYRLIETMPRVDKVLENVWDSTTLKPGTSATYLMNDAMFYFYHIAHMAKHFIEGGIGVRAFIDMWILNHNVSYNIEQRIELLKRGGLFEFERKARKLSEIWFSTEHHDDVTPIMEQYVWNGGVYGNLKNRIMIQRTKHKTKSAFILNRIFMPYEEMQIEYPVLKEQRYLLPVYWVIRWEKCLRRGRLKHAKKELKLSKNINQNKQTDIKMLMQELDLY